jgi:Peptidase family M23
VAGLPARRERAFDFVKSDEAAPRRSTASCGVRRQRSFHKTFAFLAVTLGVAAAPAAARAASGDDTGTVADLSADAPAPTAATTPAPEPQPEPEPAPRPQPAPEPTSPPTTDPQPTTDPAPEPATPPTTEPAVTPPTLPDRELPHRAPAIETESPAPSTEPAADPASAAEQPAEDDEPVEADGIDGITRPIAFPVLGPVQYGNDFGACRDGCARHHQGNDMIGVRMQPLLAAVDGTVTKISLDNKGISGVSIRVTGDDGWYYNYFHVNNDTPGTDDGQATPEWQVEPGLTVGSRVRAGQVIGYMGDSGNAEFSVPHLHFEIRTPDHTPVNPYHSLVAAQQRETCVTGTGWTNTTFEALSPSAVAVIPLADGGRWVIDADGRLYAEGPAARVQPAPGVDCAIVQTPTAALAAAAPVAALASPVAAPAPAPAAAAAPAPAPAGDRWTVEPGDSLWHIVKRSYGTTDDAATAAVVGFVFEHNRDQLTDPNMLEVGMQLELPPLAF